MNCQLRQFPGSYSDRLLNGSTTLDCSNSKRLCKTVSCCASSLIYIIRQPLTFYSLRPKVPDPSTFETFFRRAIRLPSHSSPSKGYVIHSSVPCSSAVERLPVKQDVRGSIPRSAASFVRRVRVARAA